MDFSCAPPYRRQDPQPGYAAEYALDALPIDPPVNKNCEWTDRNIIIDCVLGDVTGSEDFAYYLQHKPGCFLRLGNGTDSALLHNPKYDFNDQNLSYGAAYWTRLVERFLDAA